jgi:glucose-6-phosphate 1-epimerase
MTSDLDALRSRFSIPGVVSIDRDPHGLAVVTALARGATAQVYLHGAHVRYYKPRGAVPVLFMSEKSNFAEGTAIRGGVPIIFPWFGPHPTDSTKPAHGWARTRSWTLEGVTHESDAVTVQFSLAADGFALDYGVVVGPELRMELGICNAGAAPVTFEEALHTYLLVADVRQVTVEGLSGRQYLDKVDGMKRKTQSGPITITGETDRVYLDTPDTVAVHDPAGGRRITVAKEGSASTVVWNPWVEKSKKMPDFGDDEWPRMLCVETANVAENAVTLEPGRRHVMRAAVRVE